MPLPRNTLQTVPASFDMGVDEVLPLTVDFGVNLDEGETLITAGCIIERVDGTSIVSQATHLQGAASISGSQVTQAVKAIAEKKQYRLRFNVVTSLNREWSALLTINGVNT